MYLISRQQNKDQMLLYQPFPWWWLFPGWRPLPQLRIPEELELATRSLRGNISSRWLCLEPALADFSLLSLSSSFASVASGESVLRKFDVCCILHLASQGYAACAVDLDQLIFFSSSTNVSMRQSGVMAEGAAFRSFKDTVSRSSKLSRHHKPNPNPIISTVRCSIPHPTRRYPIPSSPTQSTTSIWDGNFTPRRLFHCSVTLASLLQNV